VTTVTLADTLRPTHLVVDLDALAHNLAAVRAVAGSARVLAILKANAYGHGLVATARLYERLGVELLGVATLEEGIELREAGVATPILVLGGIVEEQIPLFLAHELALTASSVDKIRAIADRATDAGLTARVHLKVDTGMERIGVHWYSCEPMLRAARAAEVSGAIAVDGLYSHLSAGSDPQVTSAQRERFDAVSTQARALGLRLPLRHLANSEALLSGLAGGYEMIRPGLLLYGYAPDGSVPPGFQSALTWMSRVVYFKVVPAGAPVSYGGSWAPEQQTRIVTVPVGYGDGYTRRMSGKAEVGLRGRRYPVVGRICMDQILVDIGWDSAYNGDPVVLLGGLGAERVTLAEIAAWSDTIPWEVLTCISSRVPRIYVGEHARALGLANG